MNGLDMYIYEIHTHVLYVWMDTYPCMFLYAFRSLFLTCVLGCALLWIANSFMHVCACIHVAFLLKCVIENAYVHEHMSTSDMVII
jgi:hypothetical protein